MPHDVTVAPQSASPSALAAPTPPPIPIRAEPLPSATAEPPRAAPPLKMSEIAPTQGDLNTLLAAEWKKASGLGLKLYTEMYADWCKPCRVVAKVLSDPAFAERFRGLYIVRLNIDDWQEKLHAAGFKVRYIPAFYGVGARGEPTGKNIDERAWGEPGPPKPPEPTKVARVLGDFFKE